MAKNEIIEKLKEIFVKVNNINCDNADEATKLRDDLGINSVALIYLVVGIEEEFDITMDDVTFDTFQTILPYPHMPMHFQPL